ncbi:tolloid-like protein 2 [Physella acuta]|uniref:tolloid-like protein 2 n=1 Tax=Physella acuta TaxID=109671 RepID=UPI0027DD44EC|nr:tolloid-like protein 2 [Physella acuta]
MYAIANDIFDGNRLDHAESHKKRHRNPLEFHKKFSSQAASPVCNTLPPGLYDYGQTCSSSSQCVTGFCSNSRCACASGTTYITCVAACVSNCNSTITAASGTITNPGYPSSYSGQCFWTIQGSTGSIIAFNVTYLDMESVNSCSSNYLELFDGPSSSYRTFGKMCTSWQVLTVSTTSNMYVVFSTSASGRFHATFKIQGTSTTLQDASGFIVSPGFPLVYLDNKVYDWTIVGRSGTFINLNIDTFKLEGTFPECKYDYLQVYDGSSASSPAYPKYCGKSAPGMIVSTSNYMHIVFRTDDSSVYKGFNATYYTQGTVATLYESGKVASPGYPLNYLNRQDITWTLTTRAGTYLILK